MNSEKVKDVINIINYMDIKDKLRLAISVSNSDYTNILYNKKKLYEKYNNLLKEIDDYYRTTLINFNKYKLVTFTMAKMLEMSKEEQNQVVLYLFNNINLPQNS